MKKKHLLIICLSISFFVLIGLHCAQRKNHDSILIASDDEWGYEDFSVNHTI